MKTKTYVLAMILLSTIFIAQKRIGINGKFQGDNAFTVEGFSELSSTNLEQTSMLITNKTADEVEISFEVAITYTCNRVKKEKYESITLKGYESYNTGNFLNSTSDKNCIDTKADGTRTTIIGVDYLGLVTKNISADNRKHKKEFDGYISNVKKYYNAKDYNRANEEATKAAQIAFDSDQNQLTREWGIKIQEAMDKESYDNANKNIVNQSDKDEKSTRVKNRINSKQGSATNHKQAQAQQQANDIIAKIQADQKERERQAEIQSQKLTQDTQELVQLGAAFFQGLAQDREQERQRLARQKAELEKNLSSSFEEAKNGNDQSYYDIYMAYKNAKFKNDAQKFKDLAYSTGNSSVFEQKKAAYKSQQKLDDKSAEGLYLGLQYGLFSTYGLTINVPGEKWGLLMMFRSNFKEGDIGYKFDENIINRDIYIEDNSAIKGSNYRYTFVEEGDEKQFARTIATIGASRVIKFPFFLYATVGYGAVGSYSLQKKEQMRGSTNQVFQDHGIVEVNESIESFATDFGAMIKLNRHFVISAGVSLIKFKYPEVVFGLNINLFNPSSIDKEYL